MKSKSILLAFLIGCNLILSAQNISVASFKMLVGDMTTTSMEGKRIDQNNEVAALIRVVTPETGFAFEAGALGVVDTKQKVGEIWVWVPRGSRRISIMHQQLGVLRDYRYPIEIEADRTYEMVLTTDRVTTIVEKEIRQQYLTFEITPANAMLEVDGQLWEVASDGTATKFVDFGTYKYRVQAPNHHPDAGMVTVDGSGKTQKVTVNLKPDFVTVTLKTEADAEIWVNNERKGEGSWTGPLGKGIYMIECKKANYETTMTSQEITAAMNGQTITLPAPQPIYGSLNIESIPNYASVYLDGKPVGETPLFIKEILIGSHELKLTKEGHGDHAETITITKGEKKGMKVLLSNTDYEKIAKQGDDHYDAENYEEALRCYREAAEHGNARGQDGLGKLYYNGYAVQQDYAEAVKWYRKSAEQGNALGQNHLGECYAYGHGVTQDYSEAVKWCRKSAEQGYDEAQLNLGLFYAKGRGVTQNNAEAVKWFRKSAEQGNKVGQYSLGYMYDYGLGVTEDDSEAVKWYRRSAEQGYVLAQNNLGRMYNLGSGVTLDYTEAVKWYRKSAEQGNAVGQSNLGFMYECGYGVTQDYAEAVKWYRKSAEQGYAQGQFNLGVCYEYGRGVRRSTTEALRWYQKAADQGHDEAQEAVEELR